MKVIAYCGLCERETEIDRYGEEGGEIKIGYICGKCKSRNTKKINIKDDKYIDIGGTLFKKESIDKIEIRYSINKDITDIYVSLKDPIMYKEIEIKLTEK